MYRNGEEYLARGDLKDAITTFRQAILLTPSNVPLHRELAKAESLYGDQRGAEETLSSFIAAYPSLADDSCYQILAWSLEKQDNLKEARKTLKEGLKYFPASGALYRELGNVYVQEGAPAPALNAWIDGIENAPLYAWNYYDAAKVYLNSDNVVWGILYGETFIDIVRDSSFAEEMKGALFAGYKKMFENIALKRAGRKSKTGTDFDRAVMNIFRELTPVVSDGITTENLTMARTRFIMDWFDRYSRSYPFALFSYQDKLIRTGHFEIYNEWLFGNAERKDEFEAWNKFHVGDIARLNKWQTANPLQIDQTAHYNTRDFSDMFKRKKIRSGK